MHEWFADTPSLGLFVEIARRWCQQQGGWVFWIGQMCWPYPVSLVRVERLLDRSVFVDLPRRSDAARGWVIDLVLRCPATAVVIADTRGLSMNESRRLQLAAEAGSALALLWRCESELKALSAAHCRWRVMSEPSPNSRPRWRIEPLRYKGVWARPQGWCACLVEQDDAQGLVAVSADVVNRPGTSADTARTACRQTA